MLIDFELSPAVEAAASLVFPDSAETTGETNRAADATKVYHLIIFPPVFTDSLHCSDLCFARLAPSGPTTGELI